MGNLRTGRHRALRIQQVIVAGTEAKADERSRIRYRLRLPPMVGLITAHGVFAGLIPRSRGLSGHIMFADQRFLDRLRALRINLLLAASNLLLGILARTCARGFAVVSSGGARFRTIRRPGRRCRMSHWLFSARGLGGAGLGGGGDRTGSRVRLSTGYER